MLLLYGRRSILAICATILLIRSDHRRHVSLSSRLSHHCRRRGQRRSLNTARARLLALSHCQEARDQFAWAFPQGGYEPEKDGEHLRNAAARELAEECGANLRVFFYGHSPVFHIEYLYDANSPARDHHKADGAKVFFYPAMYLGGDVALDKNELEDYQWMKLEEVVARLAPPM
jgi:8-oxo-dGTP pyrophosphatase MutT (NUDIX family)